MPEGMCSRPSRGLSSMGADLAVDEVEAMLGVGDLLVERLGELGEEVAIFVCGGFGIALQLADFA